MSPVETLRSRFGTIRLFSLDWSEFSLRSGWDTVEAFGRRVAGLAALAILCTVANPVWLPSQTAMQYEMRADITTATKRLDNLEAKLTNLPSDVAVLKEQVSRQNQVMESFSNRFWGLIAALIAWAMRQMFIEFGGREKKGTR